MSKKSRKEEHEREDISASAISSLLSTMLAEHKTALLTEIRDTYSKLEAKLDNFQNVITDHQQRLSKLEVFANSADSDWQGMQTQLTAVVTENAKLKAKLTDLEGRSRRNNIRIIGLPENIEGPRPTAFFSQLLFEVLGDGVLTSPPELDRAHRSLASKPGPKERPRPVIICFHRFQTRELVVREARRLRGKLKYKDCLIHIFEDYCPEVVEQRAQYRGVMKELYALGLKPTLRYPAKLFIFPEDGPRRHLPSVREAKDFITSYSRPGVESAGN